MLVADTPLIRYVQALDGRNQETPFAMCCKCYFSFIERFIITPLFDGFLNKHPQLLVEEMG